MKNLWAKYKEMLHAQHKFDIWTWAMIIIHIFLFAMIFGWCYEMLFYDLDLGHFIKRGHQWGPWLPIYGYGALLISAIFLWQKKNKPWLVFLGSGISCGIIEYFTGYLLDKYGTGCTWDYNTEIWNWGNINGYICARSVLFFAVSGLMLVYVIAPFYKMMAAKLSKKAFSIWALVPFVLFLADLIANEMLGHGM